MMPKATAGPRARARDGARSKILLALAVLSVVALAPTGAGVLAGNAQLGDVVQLSTSVGSIAGSDLSSAAGSPIASTTAFTVTNSNSNVDTLVRLDWTSTPYYGTNSGQTTITLRGTEYQISDLLWFKQETISGAGTTTTSEYFSPLLLENSNTILRATFTSSGNACTAWTGSPANGFSAAAAGTLTFKYYPAASPTNDAPATTDTFYYCLDTTNSQVYLATSAAYGSATLVKVYSTNSATGSLSTYRYTFLSDGQTSGNSYCLTGYTGAGTAATPDLAQCESLAYSTEGAATGKFYVLFDPPTWFPSGNQAGTTNAVTYSLSGTQWNPYAYTTTNAA